jgi:hypothetical protein
MSRCNALAVVILVGWMVSLVGCGGEAPKSSVSGKVTAGGQPVTNARINFINPKTAAVAAAELDSSGAYKIQEGLPQGSYKVFVVEVSAPPKPPMPGETPAAVPKSNIPDKYKSEGTSGLTAEIKAGENKDVDFKLD